MNIDLTPLINNKVESLEIKEEVVIPEDLYKSTDIRKMRPVKIDGYIEDLGDKLYNLHINISGNMILPCALSLEDVDYPFNFTINQSVGETEDFEQNYKIISNILDILPILWENIVLEIPNKVVKENVKVKTEGDGWSLAGEVGIKNNQLSELKELLEMEEKK